MFPTNKYRGYTLVQMAVVVLIIAILFAIAIPQFANARTQGRLGEVVGNLKDIDIAKQQYAMQYHLASGAAVISANLYPSFMNTWPTGPIAGATYLPNAMGVNPTMNGLSASTIQADCSPGGTGCPL